MLTVLKLGGSVLRDDRSFAAAACFLRDRLLADAAERLVVIVSAPFGTTDALATEAANIAVDADPLALDLLWSTGETRSVALLALHLQRVAVPAAALNIHQLGLPAAEAQSVHPGPNLLALHTALSRARVVIVPGFLGVRADGTIASLGRGGSDLTAVLIAASLDADACELIKDVPGYFTADPQTRPDAAHLRALSFAAALDMADLGCPLVQRAALEAAARHQLPLVVRSLDTGAPLTHVHTRRSSHGVRDENHSCRTAVRA